MKALFKKEIQFYLNNPIGYIVLVLFGVFANFLFVKDIFVYGSASLRPFYDILPWVYMIFVPAITMRLIAEEKRTNTIEILLSLPLSELQIVLAKYLSAMFISVLGLILTLGLPISLYALTGAESTGSRIYLPEVLTGYFGVILLISVFVSISLYFSSLTKNQILAFLMSVVVLFFLIIFSTDFSASVLSEFLQEHLNYFSPATQAGSFFKGVVDIRSLYYFLSMTVLFLFLTVVDLEKRK